MANTATLYSFEVKYFPKESMNVLFQTPGIPVTPIIIELNFSFLHFNMSFLALTWSSVLVLSIKVIAFDNASLHPFFKSLNKFIYLTAIVDISTLTFFGSLDTSTASLAGGSLLKYLLYTLLTSL